MSLQRIAYRYAKALIELAEEQKVLGKVHEDLQTFSAVCKENRDFRNMLNNPVVTHDRKLKILKALFEKRFHKITNSFLEISTRKNREEVLEATALEFNNQYNIKQGIDEASITTTFELDNKLRSEFLKAVKAINGREAVLKEKVDKEIIGGYILKIEDRQIDDSIRSKLKELEYKFGENPYLGKL